MFKKYTKEQLIKAIADSTSIAQVLKKLGVKPYGGNYQVVKGYIAKLGLDVSHHTGQQWSKNKTFGPKTPIDDFLSNKKPIQSYKLKNKLLKRKYFDHICNQCKLTKWLDQPIPLELHHIDGNNQNNSLINLVLLCPNCHALTSNYRGKNKK